MRILVFATLLTIMPAAHGSGFAQTAGELVEVCLLGKHFALATFWALLMDTISLLAI